MSLTIEKSFDVSENTKYAFYYSPRLICSCEIRCKFRSVNGKLKRVDKVKEAQESSLQDDLFKIYREKKQIDLDSNQSSSYSNYNKNLNNLTFYLRLLNLSDRTTCSNYWHTCSDSPSYPPFPITEDLSNPDFDHISLFDSLHNFLNNVDQRQIDKCLNAILIRDPFKKIFNNFSNLNKRLFNDTLKGIVCRWSECSSNFASEFDLEESCDGRLMWTIKLNKKILGKESLLEMTLAFVNIEMNSLNFDFKKQNEIILKMEKIFKNLLKKISDLTRIDLNVPYKTRPLLYNYCLMSENKKSKKCFTKTNYKFMSYNLDDSVLIEPVISNLTKDIQYETIKCCHHSDTNDLSSDYAVLFRISNPFVESISEDVFLNSKDDILSSTIVDQEYDLLCDCRSEKSDNLILKTSTIIENGGSVQNLVETPFNKRQKTDNSSCKSSTDYNNNVQTRKMTDSKLETWLKNLNAQTEKFRSMALFSIDKVYASDDDDDDVDDEFSRKNGPDENIILLRNKIFDYINETLKGILSSMEKLEEFRTNFVQLIFENENKSMEEFTQDVFDLISNNIFHKILKNVRLEWSNRLRSTAASTILDKGLDKSTAIVIRLATNLLSKLSRIDLIQILLIEHEYAETLELAHIWQCSKCDEKRIRFYNIPPTDSQKGEHASKCNGTFVKIKTP